MSEPRFVFRLTAYDTKALLPQVSRALELRNEIVSRAKYPFLWKAKDKRAAKGKDRPPKPRPEGKPNPYDKLAAKLLKGKDEFLPEDNIRILLYDEGLKSHASYTPFTEFYGAIETDDTFLLVYGPLVTLLQKKDLIEGDIDELRELFKERIPVNKKV